MTLMRLSAALCLLAILSLKTCLGSTNRNRTIDDSDPSVVLSPFSAWALSDQAQGVNGTFSFSNTENAMVVFSFTGLATAVFWQGFKRTGPSLYAVCLDCTGLSQSQLVDGHAPDAQSINSVTTLFSKTFTSSDVPRNHTLTITNLNDPRFGNSPSQITVDSFVVTCPNPPFFAPPMYPVASTPSITSIASASPTSVGHWSRLNSKATLSAGAIVGIAFSGVIIFFGVISMTWWLFRRRASGKRYKGIFGADGGKQEPRSGEESPMFSTLRVPPRNSEQASMVGTPFPISHSDPEKQSSSRSPFLSQRSLLTPSPRIPSTCASTPFRKSSARSDATVSEWGEIPVILGNPFASPHDLDTDNDSYTSLQSSELANAADDNTAQAILRKVAARSVKPSISGPQMWRQTEGGPEKIRIQNPDRGWRQIEAGKVGRI